MKQTILFLITVSMSIVCYAKQLRIGIIDTGFKTVNLSPLNLCDGGLSSASFIPGESLFSVKNNEHGNNIIGIIQTSLKEYPTQDYCFIMYKAFGYDTNIYNTTEALEKALADKVDVVNLSFGGWVDIEEESKAIKDLLDNKVTVIVAAGNSDKKHKVQNLNLKCNYYPACSDERIIMVGNKEENGRFGSTSNYAYLLPNFVTAAGEHVCGNNVCLTGTSQATALVTGWYAKKLINEIKLKQMEK